ncbi:MgtC/SapB family protein [Chitinophaga lutea]
MDSIIIDTGTLTIKQSDFIIRLLVTLGIGFLIGLEREHAALKEKAAGFAGIRTFVFVSLLGFIGALGGFLFSPWVYIGVLTGVLALVAISYWITASAGDLGSTTEFSALIAFLLGGMALLGFIEISLMITVVVVVMLSAKLKLQTAIGKITSEELYDFIRFIVIALLIFPFLPDKNMGPFEVLNPREIGWVVILTSGLGFAGYVMMKLFGAGKGILLTGIIGGMVSSTAVTWLFAKKSKENEALSGSCAVAIFAASSIMILRVFVWTFIFNQHLFRTMLPVMLCVFVAAAGVTLFYYFRNRKAGPVEAKMKPGKPLDLQGALFFGALYTAILLIVSYANAYLDERGMLISSAIAGLSDIDAITISVSKLANLTVPVLLAAQAVLIATMSNTLVKMGIGVWAGSRQLRRKLYVGYGVIFGASILALVYITL